MSDQSHSPETLRDELMGFSDKVPRAFPDGTVPGFYPSAIVQIQNKVTPMYESIDKAVLMQEILEDKVRRPFFSYLTNHGRAHIEKVEMRAQEILRACRIHITPYELYYLLASIWLHDAGMIYGRDGHEKSIARILDDIGDAAGNALERRVLMGIASAHSGVVDGQPNNMDTIGQLGEQVAVGNLNVREQLLAAILRLADELA